MESVCSLMMSEKLKVFFTFVQKTGYTFSILLLYINTFRITKYFFMKKLTHFKGHKPFYGILFMYL